MAISEDDEQLIQDAAHIGRAMIGAAKELAEKQGRPLYEFSEAAIQALIVGHSVLVEDDPVLVSLRKKAAY